MERRYYSVELNKEDAEKLKAFLKSKEIYFEPSSCYNLIHFEVKVNEAELKMVDDFLIALDNELR